MPATTPCSRIARTGAWVRGLTLASGEQIAADQMTSLLPLSGRFDVVEHGLFVEGPRAGQDGLRLLGVQLSDQLADDHGGVPGLRLRGVHDGGDG